MTTIGKGQVGIWATGNGLEPLEGPKAIVTTLNFGLDNQFDINQLNVLPQGDTALMSMVQTVFINTSNTDDPVTVTMQKSGQAIVAAGRTQGYYPVIAPNNWDLTVSCSDINALVFVALLNYEVRPAVWVTN